MQINQSTWLHNKKSQLLKQILQLEQKSYSINQEQVTLINKVQQDLKVKENELIQLKRLYETQKSSSQRQIEVLENLIAKNQNELEKRGRQVQDLNAKNKQLTQKLMRQTSNCKDKEKQLLQIKQFNQTKFSQQEQSFTKILQQQQSKLNEVVQKYQSLLKEKQIFYQNKLEAQVQIIRKQNEEIIKKIENKYASRQVVEKSDQNKLKKEYGRLLDDHKKLLEEVTEYKSMILGLETSLTNEVQQNKFKSKENQLRVENYRKELQLMKETQQRLISKNKNYIQKNQELSWQLKQNELKFNQEIKRIKKISQRDLSQIIEKSQRQVMTLKSEINILKNNDLTLLNQENITLKRTIQILEKQKSSLQNEIQSKTKQILKINQQYSQIRKIKDQNEQLKKQNLKRAQQLDVFEEQIKRLKQKCNKIATLYQDLLKNKQIMEKENKMLLEEIIYLRDKRKGVRRDGTENSQLNENFATEQADKSIIDKARSKEMEGQESNVLEMKSQVSQDYEDVNEYKEVIKQLDKGMQEALAKIQEKNSMIQKQKSMIAKMQRIIAYGK